VTSGLAADKLDGEFIGSVVFIRAWHVACDALVAAAI
jgi:hypothetical protein